MRHLVTPIHGILNSITQLSQTCMILTLAFFGSTQVACFSKSQKTLTASLLHPSLGSMVYSPKTGKRIENDKRKKNITKKGRLLDVVSTGKNLRNGTKSNKRVQLKQRQRKQTTLIKIALRGLQYISIFPPLPHYQILVFDNFFGRQPGFTLKIAG